MPRPLRLDYPGAWFHVTSRGNERRTVFIDDADRLKFLLLLAGAQRRSGIVCHAYCLMGNHYHLVVESVDGRLSDAIQYLNGSFAMFFNRRRGRVGHLFQGRFHSSLIERDSYLLEAVRYVELNPCRAGLVTNPFEWPWGSFANRFRGEPGPANLDVSTILDHFGASPERLARYQAFIRDGLGADAPSRFHEGDLIIGSELFIKAHAHRARLVAEKGDVPRRQQVADRPSLGELFCDASSDDTVKHLAVIACRQHGHSFAAVARKLGVHYTTISRWVRTSRCDDAWSDP